MLTENFVELDEIKPVGETLQQIFHPSMILKIDPHKPKHYACTFDETRLEFQDNPLDPIGLFEPTKIKFFNYNDCTEQDINLDMDFAIFIRLSNKVQIQKRVVYNILMMFGDVGGLNDFLCLFLATVFGYFSENLLVAEMIQKLFHFTKKRENPFVTGQQIPPLMALKTIKELKLSTCYILLHSLGFA